jgi:hypothetical protein
VLGYGNLTGASLRYGVELLARCAHASPGAPRAVVTSVARTPGEGV